METKCKQCGTTVSAASNKKQYCYPCLQRRREDYKKRRRQEVKDARLKSATVEIKQPKRKYRSPITDAEQAAINKRVALMGHSFDPGRIIPYGSEEWMQIAVPMMRYERAIGGRA